MSISRDGWLTIVVGMLALAMSVTPGVQTWWIAVPLWVLFVVTLVRWVRQREKSSGTDVSWLDIEARFKELEQLNLQHKGDGPVHAFESDTADEGSGWYVGGGGRDVTQTAKRLCRLAGRKLKTSGIAAQYPRLARETDDLARWLFLLAELDQATRDQIDGQGETRYYYNIQYLTKASLAGCMECLRLAQT
jgi:hypothetical protein